MAMEAFLIFFLGVLTGLLLPVIIIMFGRPQPVQIQNDEEGEEEPNIVMRQSLMYRISEMLEYMREETLTQSQLHNGEKTKVRFVQTPDDKIFWIEDNKLFWTEIGFDGFDITNRKPAKTQDLTEEEMENLLIILNILQNG